MSKNSGPSSSLPQSNQENPVAKDLIEKIINGTMEKKDFKTFAEYINHNFELPPPSGTSRDEARVRYSLKKELQEKEQQFWEKLGVVIGNSNSFVPVKPKQEVLSDFALHQLAYGLMEQSAVAYNKIGGKNEFARGSTPLDKAVNGVLRAEGFRHPIGENGTIPDALADHYNNLYKFSEKENEKSEKMIEKGKLALINGHGELTSKNVYSHVLFAAYGRALDPKADEVAGNHIDFLNKVNGKVDIKLELNMESKINDTKSQNIINELAKELKSPPDKTKKSINQKIMNEISNISNTISENINKVAASTQKQAEKLGKNITKQTGKIAESFEKQANSTIKNISTKIDKLGETIKSGSVKTTNAISDQAKKLGKNITKQTEKLADQVAKKSENFKDSASKNLNINKIQKLASSFKKQANYTFENIKNILKNDDLKKLLNKEKLKIPPVQNRAEFSFTSTPEKRPSPPSAPPPLHLLKNENNPNKSTSSKSFNPSQTPTLKNNSKKNKSKKQNSL